MKKMGFFCLLVLFMSISSLVRAEYIVNPNDRLRLGVSGYVRGYTGKVESLQYNSVFKTEPKVFLTYDVTDTLQLKGLFSYQMVRNDRFAKNKKSRFNDAYVSIDSKTWGSLTVGQIRNVAYLMHVAPVEVGGLGSDDSDLSYFYQRPSGFFSSDMTYIDTDCREPKISYMTPSLNGFKWGLSVVQSEDEDYETYAPEGIKADHGKGIISAVQYKTNIASFNIGASAGYAYYHDDRFLVSDSYVDTNHSEFSSGFLVEKNNYSAGIAYKRVMFQDKINLKDSQTFSTGVAYDGNPWGVSVTWLHSFAESTEKNRYNQYMLSGKYMLNNYIKLFSSVGRIEFLRESVRSTKEHFCIAGIEFKI